MKKEGHIGLHWIRLEAGRGVYKGDAFLNQKAVFILHLWLRCDAVTAVRVDFSNVSIGGFVCLLLNVTLFPHPVKPSLVRV